MSIESSFSCSEAHAPKRERGILQRMDEFLTFREESIRILEERKLLEKQQILQETKIACAKERDIFVKNDFQKINLDTLSEIQTTIGRGGIVRKLLFGMNEDIMASHGVLGYADEQVLESCGYYGQKTPMCKELGRKKREQIQLSGIVPINFRRNLDEVWQHKIHKRSNKDTVSDIRTFYENEVRPYTGGERNFTKISRKEYDSEVHASIESVRNQSDMDKGFTAYGISSHNGLMLAKAFANRISEADLIALGITELMDKNTPEFNNKVFTVLLEKVGKEYLLFSPALGDNLLSYGPYQLTRSAVDGKNGGATMADDRFTGGKILKIRDITKFPLEDHHKAAYLLALTNVALLVKAIPSEYTFISGRGRNKKKTTYDLQKICLDLVKKGDKDVLNLFAGFIAGAHNRQDTAKRGVINWLIARCDGKNKMTAGGNLSEHLSKNGPPTVGNNVDKQTGKGKDSGNRGIVIASLGRN